MSSQCVVLYEDSRGATKSTFPLHQVVLRVVSRFATERPYHALVRAIVPSPKRGVDKALSAYRESQWPAVVAVLDRDELHDHVQPKLPAGACRRQLFQQIHGSEMPRTASRAIVLFEENLETLLREARDCSAFPQTLSDRAAAAIDRHNPQARDEVLAELAKQANAAWLDELRARFKPLDRLAQEILRLVPS